MRPTDETMLTASIQAMKEKLSENIHKEPITLLSLQEAVRLMDNERKELQEAIDMLFCSTADTTETLKDIRRELADILNFAGAAVHDCDRKIAELDRPEMPVDAS